MIDVLIADDQELFHIGMAEILAVANDVRIVGQPQSPELLLGTLKQAKPHVLVLSTSFLPALSKIQRALRRRETALLVLAEDNDRIAYTRWLRARGVVYRSMDGPVIVDAVRRVARGELFIQNSSSDTQRSTVQSGTTARLVPLSLTSGPPEPG
jgi:DNA-binding NarL/FixJ family response regulator